MIAKKLPGTATVPLAEGKAPKTRTSPTAPPTPEDVAEQMKRQRAARPGQGPKSKGRIG